MVAAFKDIDWSCIHVWRIALDAPVTGSQLAAWTAMLSPEEQNRASRFHSADLRRDYVVCHAALRSVLGQCLGIAPQNLRFRSEPAHEATGAAGGAATGKPALDHLSGPASEALDLRFNLSHTRGAALIAVAQAREVGIDIEWQRPMEDLEGMARAVMSDEEHDQWFTLKPEAQTVAFYRLWTRKESYLKAIGLGLYRDLHDVTVPISPEFCEPAQGALVKDRTDQGLWTVADIPMDGPWAASICNEGAGLPTVLVHDWRFEG